MRRALPLSVLLLACSAPAAAAQQEAESAPTAVAPPLVQTPLAVTRTQARRLQRALGVRADGKLGPRTSAALKRWERREGLTPDGRPDPETLGRLGIDLTAAQLALIAPSPLGAAASEPTPAATSGAAGPQSASPAPASSAPAPAAPTDAATRAVAAARTQLGTPYERAGAAPGGFDCSGLTAWAFAQVGVTLPHSSFAQAKLGTAVARTQIQPGDLVLFDTAGPGASDVGIATSPTTVISATTRGVREHAIFDAYWGAHQVGARHL